MKKSEKTKKEVCDGNRIRKRKREATAGREEFSVNDMDVDKAINTDDTLVLKQKKEKRVGEDREERTARISGGNWGNKDGFLVFGSGRMNIFGALGRGFLELLELVWVGYWSLEQNVAEHVCYRPFFSAFKNWKLNTIVSIHVFLNFH